MRCLCILIRLVEFGLLTVGRYYSLEVIGLKVQQYEPEPFDLFEFFLHFLEVIYSVSSDGKRKSRSGMLLSFAQRL